MFWIIQQIYEMFFDAARILWWIIFGGNFNVNGWWMLGADVQDEMDCAQLGM